jgi:predicted amino acid-binding ACT domain protein
MAEVETSYYLRLRVEDKPGVLADITRILADQQISIDAMIQREPAEGESQTDIIMLTHVTREKNVDAAIAKIEALPVVKIRLRMEETPGTGLAAGRRSTWPVDAFRRHFALRRSARRREARSRPRFGASGCQPDNSLGRCFGVTGSDRSCKSSVRSQECLFASCCGGRAGRGIDPRPQRQAGGEENPLSGAESETAGRLERQGQSLARLG